MRVVFSRRYFLVFMALVGILAMACSSASDDPAPTQPPPAAPPSQAATATSSPPTSIPTVAPTSKPDSETPQNGGSSTAFSWEISEVDRGTKPSLALDSNDIPHIAYMLESFSGFVRLATLNGAEWDVSDIQDGYFYGPLDIAIGADDVPRVTYHDHQDAAQFRPNKGDAIVAVQSNGSWSIDAIADQGHDGWDTRIFVDNDNGVHISAIDPVDFGGNGVEYYHQDPATGDWPVEEIGSGAITYRYATSVAVSPNGNPSITYYDQELSGDGNLALATRNGSDWSIEKVDSVGDVGLFSYLAIDDDGRYHISYFKRTSSSSGLVKYATKRPDDTEWDIREVDSLDSLLFGFVGARNITSLDLDSDGNPWIAYTDQSTVKLARWDGSEWQIGEVSGAGRRPFGQLVVLKIDSNDEPHITYFEETSNRPLNGIVIYAKGIAN